MRCCDSQNKLMFSVLVIKNMTIHLFVCLMGSVWISLCNFKTCLGSPWWEDIILSVWCYINHTDDRGHLMDWFFGCLLETTLWGLMSGLGKCVWDSVSASVMLSDVVKKSMQIYLEQQSVVQSSFSVLNALHCSVNMHLKLIIFCLYRCCLTF